MGAAIRHAAAQLGERPNRHRLLQILSDGKPSDSDYYEGRYAIEDTQRAIMDAQRRPTSPTYSAAVAMQWSKSRSIWLWHYRVSTSRVLPPDAPTTRDVVALGDFANGQLLLIADRQIDQYAKRTISK
ncbi:Uncharacterised protein [Halioglobus japonicus]|nr:Uncharacterised protein [Halioglobus japonicus]